MRLRNWNRRNDLVAVETAWEPRIKPGSVRSKISWHWNYTPLALRTERAALIRPELVSEYEAIAKTQPRCRNSHYFLRQMPGMSRDDTGQQGSLHSKGKLSIAQIGRILAPALTRYAQAIIISGKCFFVNYWWKRVGVGDYAHLMLPPEVGKKLLLFMG